jgi:uncharacterized membrane protein YgcG
VKFIAVICTAACAIAALIVSLWFAIPFLVLLVFVLWPGAKEPMISSATNSVFTPFESTTAASDSWLDSGGSGSSSSGGAGSGDSGSSGDSGGGGGSSD